MHNTTTPLQTLDHEVIDGLRSILGSDIDDLFNDFLQQAPGEISQLKAMFQDNNLENLSRIAHSLKGSSGNLGIAALSNACLKLEHNAKNGISSKIESDIHAIESNFKAAQKSIQNLLTK